MFVNLCDVGCLYQCDRCGKQEYSDDILFLRMPGEWISVKHNPRNFHLCKECADQYDKFVYDFVEGYKEDNHE